MCSLIFITTVSLSGLSWCNPLSSILTEEKPINILKSSLPKAFSSPTILVSLPHSGLTFLSYVASKQEGWISHRAWYSLIVSCSAWPLAPIITAVISEVFIRVWPWYCPFRQSSLRSTWWPMPQVPTMWTLMQLGVAIKLQSKFSAKCFFLEKKLQRW